ncbi:hypothetical protein AVEN_21914-1 [Araneus ventricosus]|uniref:Uncharacterized protein n=1 Tax=Araneus ventricosus TaxID=182803 RepID=A0A4Y2D3A4_ARAVE|nr:hypothetical protein AVEN_21914-1 [Araneus ventricosus]
MPHSMIFVSIRSNRINSILRLLFTPRRLWKARRPPVEITFTKSFSLHPPLFNFLHHLQLDSLLSLPSNVKKALRRAPKLIDNWSKRSITSPRHQRKFQKHWKKTPTYF